MDVLADEFIVLLKKNAQAVGDELCLKSFCRYAMQELNLSVREFWSNYKVYLIGAYGHIVEFVENFEETKMGKLVAAYGKFYGKTVEYEAVVRDVLMGLEHFYIDEYGKDISDLRMLLNEFENDMFQETEHGNILRKLIEEEENDIVSNTLTKWMNDDTPSTVDTMIEKETFDSSGAEEKRYNDDDVSTAVLTKPNSSSQKGTYFDTVEDSQECLKKRKQKLRQLRKENKAKKVDNKIHVETDAFGLPNGKGRRELRHFLTVVTLSTIPTGIIESKDMEKQTINRIVKKAEEEFLGDWSAHWAKECIRATLRQRKSKTMKQLRDPLGKQELQTSLTAHRFKASLKMLKNPSFQRKSDWLKSTREMVGNISHAGRGGFSNIRIRYVQEHNEIPSAEKVRDIANTVAEQKMEAE